MKYDIDTYLEIVCENLPTKKLRKQIRNEFSEHIEDGKEDFKEQGLSEDEAADRILTEMGNPRKINRELRQAHKKFIWYVRLRNICIFSLVIITSFAVIPPLFDDYSKYRCALSLEEAEISIAEKAKSQFILEPVQFLGEVEYNGTVYRYYYYIQESFAGKPQSCYNIFTVHSIKAFGKDFKELFSEVNYSSVLVRDDDIRPERSMTTHGIDPIYSKDPSADWHSDFNAEAVVFFKPSEAKYFKAEFCPEGYFFGYYDSKPAQEKLLKSDFYEIPQALGIVIVETPKGYYITPNYTFYDENKQEIVYNPEISN